MFFFEDLRKQEWSVYDYTASSFFWLTGSIAVPLNVLLLLLILFRSPSKLRLYSIFLFNTALADVVFSLSATASQIRIIPNRWEFAYVSLGPAGWIGGSGGGYRVYCLLLHCLFYTFLCFPLSFGFRYFVLVRPAPRALNCALLCSFLWILACGQHILFLLVEAPSEEIVVYLKINKPEYNLDHFFVSGNNLRAQPLTALVLSTILLPMFPIYAAVIVLYKRTSAFLEKNRTRMSEGTSRRHRKLLEVLRIQASVPLVFVFPPILLYILYHLEVIQVQAIEYLVYSIFSLVPLSSPLITIHYIRPYRDAVFRFLPIRNSSIGPDVRGSIFSLRDGSRSNSMT